MLEVKGIYKRFGEFVVLDGVDIKASNITLLIGPNGSGKTTLLNVISGIYKADAGEIFFNGKNITKLRPDQRYKLGIVRTFQIPQPLKKMTVLENLLFAVENPGENIAYAFFKKSWKEWEKKYVDKAFEILNFLKLDHLWNSESYKLSGGQLKLLELGRALMCDAKIILLDEPIGGVAPQLALEIFSTIKRAKEELKVEFLIIEHRLETALEYVDYVYALFNGRVISQGKPEEVIKDKKVIEAYLGETYA